MKVNFSISTEDVKSVCEREGFNFLSSEDHEQILKDTKKIYELNIKDDMREYIAGQTFNHVSKLRTEYNKKNKL